MTSKPFSPPNAIDFADRALDHALPRLHQELHAHQRGEVAVGEDAEESLKKPAERLEHAGAGRPTRNPSATAVPSRPRPTPWSSSSGPRQTASTAMPGQQRQHDRHPRDQGDAAGCVPQLEPRCRDRARAGTRGRTTRGGRGPCGVGSPMRRGGSRAGSARRPPPPRRDRSRPAAACRARRPASRTCRGRPRSRSPMPPASALARTSSEHSVTPLQSPL